MSALNETEQEAIILSAVWTMIDDMVNFDMFWKNNETEDTNLLPSTGVHQRLFNILLCDFLSQPQRRRRDPLPFDLPEPPSGARPADLTYLFYLRRVCATPKLGNNPATIRACVDAFSNWLEGSALVERIWLPSIDAQLDMRIERIAFLKICGDIAKHNFVRLEANVRKIRSILKENGIDIDDRNGYLVLPEFYDWFHAHIFNYHASTIAEFLNNIRWSISDYLQTELHRALERTESSPGYRFHIPTNIDQPIAREMYWELMNKARSGPFFPRFTVTRYLKGRF